MAHSTRQPLDSTLPLPHTRLSNRDTRPALRHIFPFTTLAISSVLLHKRGSWENNNATAQRAPTFVVRTFDFRVAKEFPATKGISCAILSKDLICKFTFTWSNNCACKDLTGDKAAFRERRARLTANWLELPVYKLPPYMRALSCSAVYLFARSISPRYKNPQHNFTYY